MIMNQRKFLVMLICSLKFLVTFVNKTLIKAPEMIWSAVLPSPAVDTSCRFDNPPEYGGLDNYCLVSWLSWHFYVRLFHEEEN